jgi:hypothetical protein
MKFGRAFREKLLGMRPEDDDETINNLLKVAYMM